MPQSFDRDSKNDPRGLLRYYIGAAGAFIGPLILAAASITFFVVFQVFDLTGLAVAGFIGLFASSWLARNQQHFWDAAIAGIASRTSATLLLLMLLVGMLGQMFKATGVSQGFIWLAEIGHVNGGVFVMLTFLITCAIAMATGSSLGTMFTMFPIMYASGVAIGADAVLLAGAILSGAIFGDNLAPISDTTVISATTQKYRRRAGNAEIGGVVKARTRYALPAAGISAIMFLAFGLMTQGNTASTSDKSMGDPLGLVMLIPVAVLIAIAFWKRDLYLAVGVGMALGTALSLATGLVDINGVLGAVDGVPTGYLVDGLSGMLPLIGLLVAVFGMIGIIEASGIFDKIISAAAGSRFGRSPRGIESMIAGTSIITTVIFAGLNGPGMMFAGPVTDRIGATVELHPYRRSNIMDCFTMGVGVVVPIASSFLLVASLNTQGYEGVPELSIFQVLTGAFYPFVLTAIMVFSVVAGWGRSYEGPDGAELRNLDSDASLEPGRIEPALITAQDRI
ncbi:Na+/H+ antiporter NhaC family protein [Cryobacterium sp. Y50]|uniref:Na+/H+ antiporter NhaC family protein n=1 Tax=Cryobacterium sp. Y50 TaxID=2048286 RepID=UPI001304E87C|nr:Na+/H+ antiporter NhaC family protein [Cryobacterium sp. Y50]